MKIDNYPYYERGEVFIKSLIERYCGKQVLLVNKIKVKK